jgi:hypothetical protein
MKYLLRGLLLVSLSLLLAPPASASCSCALVIGPINYPCSCGQSVSVNVCQYSGNCLTCDPVHSWKFCCGGTQAVGSAGNSENECGSGGLRPVAGKRRHLHTRRLLIARVYVPACSGGFAPVREAI